VNSTANGLSVASRCGYPPRPADGAVVIAAGRTSRAFGGTLAAMRVLVAVAVAVLCATRAAVADPGGVTAGLDVLPLGPAPESVELAFAHGTGNDAADAIAGARFTLAGGGFLDGIVPVVWDRQQAAFALGNVGVRGGLALPSLGLAALSLRVEVPTAPSVGGGMATALAAGVPRVADGELFLPGTTSIELMGDWRWDRPAWWLQAEAGIEAIWQADTPSRTVLRATVAGGVPLTPWLELAASFVTRSDLLDHDPPEDFVHTLALGVIAHTPRGDLGVRVEVPVDASARMDNRFVAAISWRTR
jgi:hypothetical protein